MSFIMSFPFIKNKTNLYESNFIMNKGPNIWNSKLFTIPPQHLHVPFWSLQSCSTSSVLVAQSCPTLWDPWTQGSLWDPEIESRSPALQVGSLLSEPPGKPLPPRPTYISQALFFIFPKGISFSSFWIHIKEITTFYVRLSYVLVICIHFLYIPEVLWRQKLDPSLLEVFHST